MDNIEKCRFRKWRFVDGYVKSGNSINEPLIQLHRYILDITNRNIKVDHIDRNPLNNRKSNLRICTSQENTCNQGLSKINTSGITGVNWTNKDNRWRAYITYKGKRIHLGQYINIDDAIKARLQAEKKYFGEFAPQQHLYKKYGISS